MRTWIIIVSFVMILVLVSFGEQYVMDRFFPEINDIVTDIRYDIINENSPRENIDRLTRVWDKTRLWAFVFSNHESFADYEDCINEMQEYLEINAMSMIYYKTVHLENLNNHLRESMKFRPENIF